MFIYVSSLASLSYGCTAVSSQLSNRPRHKDDKLSERVTVIALRRAAAIALVLVLSAAAQAQIINRVDVPAGEATPTGASFSILFPVPYSDLEMRAADPDAPTIVVRMVTGITADGVRLSASETPFLPGVAPQPVEDFMNGLKEKSGATLSDVNHQHSANAETLAFTLIDAIGGGNYFDVVRAHSVEYVMLIQFHRAQRDKATAMKDAFFGSFKTLQQ
jgi:hypothetical protein